MNYAIVLRLLSYILYCEAALLLLPAMASLIYGEWMVLAVFLLTAAVSADMDSPCVVARAASRARASSIAVSTAMRAASGIMTLFAAIAAIRRGGVAVTARRATG